MSGITELVRALERGPRTTAQLAEATYDSSGSVARYMAKLIKAGRAKRIDGLSGRGHRATYALFDVEAAR